MEKRLSDIQFIRKLIITILFVFFIFSITYATPITINDVSTADSIENDIVKESGFNHLNISDQTPYSDLVLYMPFDYNSSGTTYDYTENNNDGTLKNGVAYTDSGKYGGAYDFDGVDDYVEIDSTVLPSGGDTATFMGWYNLDGPGDYSWNRLLDIQVGDNSFAMGLVWDEDDDQYGVFTTDDLAYVTGSDPPLNEWHHWAGVVDNSAGTITFYLDGNQKAQILATTSWSQDLVVSIGKRYDANDQTDGTIDEVMIFNRSLNSTEISDLYNKQAERFKDSGWQDFEQNITSGNNTINVTTDYEGLLETNLTLELSYFDGSWTSAGSQLVTGENSYLISTGATNVSLNYTYNAGSDNGPYSFYSSTLKNDITLTTEYTITPVFTDLANISILNSEPLIYDINATNSGVGLDSFVINDTTSFKINSTTGVFENDSTLNVGIYYVNISVNDTLGNENSEVIYINVTAACFDSASIGNIGTEPLCQDMLIVDSTMLDNAVSINSGQDFAIEYNGVNYTLGDSTNNIFTGQVTDMSSLFDGDSNFNSNINYWYTNNVTDMRYMFQDASSFNQSLNLWNTSQVNNLAGTFIRASSFNQNISSWDTSSVTNMAGTFMGASSYNQNLSNWSTGRVLNMDNMFNGATLFNQDICWNVTNIGSKPTGFDTNAGFENLTSKQPNWGTDGSGCIPPPQVTLLSPPNNTKIFPNRTINFSFRVDTSTTINNTCSIYLNSVIEKTISCIRGAVTSTLINLSESGSYEWFVEGSDDFGTITSNSSSFEFLSIFQNHKRISKQLSFDSSNMYLSQITLTNLDTKTSPSSTVFDYIQQSYSGGSYSPAFNTSSSIISNSGKNFEGDLLNWNISSLSANSSVNVSYLLATSQNSSTSLLDQFVVGFG